MITTIKNLNDRIESLFDSEMKAFVATHRVNHRRSNTNSIRWNHVCILVPMYLYNLILLIYSVVFGANGSNHEKSITDYVWIAIIEIVILLAVGYFYARIYNTAKFGLIRPRYSDPYLVDPKTGRSECIAEILGNAVMLVVFTLVLPYLVFSSLP